MIWIEQLLIITSSLGAFAGIGAFLEECFSILKHEKIVWPQGNSK